MTAITEFANAQNDLRRAEHLVEKLETLLDRTTDKQLRRFYLQTLRKADANLLRMETRLNKLARKVGA